MNPRSSRMLRKSDLYLAMVGRVRFCVVAVYAARHTPAIHFCCNRAGTCTGRGGWARRVRAIGADERHLHGRHRRGPDRDRRRGCADPRAVRHLSLRARLRAERRCGEAARFCSSAMTEPGSMLLICAAAAAQSAAATRHARPDVLQDRRAASYRTARGGRGKVPGRQGFDAGTIDVVGFHGQTVLHAPEQRLTVQIGDGALLGEIDGHRRGLRPARGRRGGWRPGRAAGSRLPSRADRQAARAADRRAQHRRRCQRHLDRPATASCWRSTRPGQCADRRLDAARTGRPARRRRRPCRGGPRARRLRHGIPAPLLLRRAATQVARPQRFRPGACRSASRSRWRRHADGLHRGEHRPGARAFSRAAAVVGGVRRRAAQQDADGHARRPRRSQRSPRPKPRASTAIRSRRKPGPISRCARSPACPSLFPAPPACRSL